MPCVLLLEDYAPLRRVQTATLQRAGWQVLQARSAREAQRNLQRQNVDVVMLDMDIATGESWRILRTLRANRDRPPIVALFAPGSHRYAELQEDGLCIILPKPVGRLELLAGVEKALRVSRSQRNRAS